MFSYTPNRTIFQLQWNLFVYLFIYGLFNETVSFSADRGTNDTTET
jgi:hypothetical protein